MEYTKTKSHITIKICDYSENSYLYTKSRDAVPLGRKRKSISIDIKHILY